MKTLFLLVPAMRDGGQERFIATLSYILKDEYNVKIITLYDTLIGYKTNCEIISLVSEEEQKRPGYISRVLLFCKRWYRLKRLYRKYKPFACVSFGGGANRLNIETLTKGIKHFISVRGFAHCKRFNRFGFDYLTSVIADGVIVVSDEMKSNLEEYSKKRNVIRLYNAYDTETILNESTCARKLSLDDNNIHFCSLGRYTKEKGYWHLLKAFSIALEQNKKMRLHIIGSQKDSPEQYQKTERLVKDLGIEDYVTLEDNSLSPYKRMGENDVYLLSSVFEGFPNSLVEAMCCKLPVIASDCSSGPKEILKSPLHFETPFFRTEYGIVVQRFNTKENWNACVIENEDRYYAQAILYLASDIDARSNLAIAGYNRTSDFSYTQCLSNFKKIIEG